MPLLSGLRKLAVGTLMGPQKEKQINWYLEPGPLEKLINHLTPNLDKIAKIIQHHAVSVCFSISTFSLLLLLLLSSIQHDMDFVLYSNRHWWSFRICFGFS